jgi:hypothetical protein
MGRTISFLLFLVMLKSTKAASQLSLSRSADTIEKKIFLRSLPQNFYNQNLGYFCKKEIQLQKIIKLPVFIRLGSKAQVDYLERKPNAIKKE